MPARILSQSSTKAFSPSPIQTESTCSLLITFSGENVGQTPPNITWLLLSFSFSTRDIPKLYVISVAEMAIISGQYSLYNFWKSSKTLVSL